MIEFEGQLRVKKFQKVLLRTKPSITNLYIIFQYIIVMENEFKTISSGAITIATLMIILNLILKLNLTASLTISILIGIIIGLIADNL